ncbi:hypothetical protein [Metabacillus sp. RGM 3146]|uniref:hypothetical protein n=1 Tax=Metabacillus sp. RGM 3146 TaxID=3401092 RepID=UPI003B9D543B
MIQAVKYNLIIINGKRKSFWEFTIPKAFLVDQCIFYYHLVLLNNAAVGNLIRNEKTHQIPSVIQTSRAQGMHSFQSKLDEFVKSGVISMDSALPYMQGKAE